MAVAGLVACQPVVEPAPPAGGGGGGGSGGGATSVPPPCGKQVASDDFVAVVDTPEAVADEIVAFEAANQAEVDAKIAELATTGDVLSVEPDALVYATAVDPSNDPAYAAGQQWGLSAAGGGFDSAWATADGTGQVIAIIDTGVQANHEDLGITTKVLPGIDFVLVGGDGTADQNGHGTHVAGIAAASDNDKGGLGGAPGAKILPVRVLNASGSGFSSDVASGIKWAADNGATVINLSLGGCNPSAAMQSQIAYAISTRNVVVVAAAGNNNQNATVYPGAYDVEGVIAVAATNNVGAKASYSNYGVSVDIAAPGGESTSTSTSIKSTYKDVSGQPPSAAYAFLNGTSMATPFVAAAAALVRQHCPTYTPAQVLAKLQATATTPGAGLAVGRIQTGAAVTAAC